MGIVEQASGDGEGAAGAMQGIEERAAAAYRLAKLYTGYMALGYIARHTWLYSHWLFSHVYMAT